MLAALYRRFYTGLCAILTARTSRLRRRQAPRRITAHGKQTAARLATGNTTSHVVPGPERKKRIRYPPVREAGILPSRTPRRTATVQVARPRYTPLIQYPVPTPLKNVVREVHRTLAPIYDGLEIHNSSMNFVEQLALLHSQTVFSNEYIAVNDRLEMNQEKMALLALALGGEPFMDEPREEQEQVAQNQIQNTRKPSTIQDELKAPARTHIRLEPRAERMPISQSDQENRPRFPMLSRYASIRQDAKREVLENGKGTNVTGEDFRKALRAGLAVKRREMLARWQAAALAQPESRQVGEGRY